MKSRLGTIYKGILIGSTMLVPGVSGGSTAMILGIYDKLIVSVSSFFKNVKENLLFLILFSISAWMGMILLAKPILSLLEAYPKTMGFFFIGAVAGGMPTIYKQALIKRFSPTYIIYMLIGIITVTMLSFLPTGVSAGDMVQDGNAYLFLILAGIIAAAALILPGISVSYLLLVMGLYQPLMVAISTFDMKFLIPLGGGVVMGIILLTRGLEFVLRQFPRMSYLIILGFVLGSLGEVFPGMPKGSEWIICIGIMTVGYFFIYNISKTEE